MRLFLFLFLFLMLVVEVVAGLLFLLLVVVTGGGVLVVFRLDMTRIKVANWTPKRTFGATDGPMDVHIWGHGRRKLKVHVVFCKQKKVDNKKYRKEKQK